MTLMVGSLGVALAVLSLVMVLACCYENITVVPDNKYLFLNLGFNIIFIVFHHDIINKLIFTIFHTYLVSYNSVFILQLRERMDTEVYNICVY